MAANDAPETPEALRESLVELRVEHRDLDEAIERLTATPPDDDLLVRRLKKRKLMIKDRISALERLLDPDEYA
ncbi:MAG: YdcH family protein [Sterolibacteriaceae bacterium]|uniref:YdcH family protein n=1 Tax=Sulfuritalea sp. TaxID=2480090 RepID=UPI001A3D7EF3|nr:YdcH family protein [Sulfuritalea sp.]MBL8479202.1 YdcH family protein [Sterolibacteriaceae bacterium]MBN8476045.1 YdcH family protein [Sulfuritalea sp.]